jgi:hypothetical protein
MEKTESLLKAILSVMARSAFPPAELMRIVAPMVNSKKQIFAFNLCDGQTTQAEIARKAKLDKASLSRSLARWSEAGAIVRVGPEELPLHIYHLADDALEQSKRKGKRDVRGSR